MRTHPHALVVRSLLIAALLSLGAIARSNAAEISPAEQQAIGMAAISWLNLLDAGKYVENLAVTSASFRKDLTAEAWKKNHASMQKQFGAVVSRDDNVTFKTATSQSDDGKETTSYTLRSRQSSRRKRASRM